MIKFILPIFVLFIYSYTHAGLITWYLLNENNNLVKKQTEAINGINKYDTITSNKYYEIIDTVKKVYNVECINSVVKVTNNKNEELNFINFKTFIEWKNKKKLHWTYNTGLYIRRWANNTFNWGESPLNIEAYNRSYQINQLNLIKYISQSSFNAFTENDNYFHNVEVYENNFLGKLENSPTNF